MPGCSTSQSSANRYQDSTKQTTFQPASEQERQLLAQFQQLGIGQQEVLNSLIPLAKGEQSAFTLTPEDQATLDQQYASARQQLDVGNKDYADFISGGRGLRMSDTPISQQALQRQGLGLAELLSQKAAQSLNMGLAGSQLRGNLGLNLAQSVPQGTLNAFSPLFQERMASGTTRTTGWGTGGVSQTPSFMDAFGQGLQLTGQVASGFGSGGLASMWAPR